MLKKRFAQSLGLLSSQGAWDGATQELLDLSNVNFGAAATWRFALLGLPPFTNAGNLGAQDSYPPTLAAANGSLVIGAGSTPFATLLGLYLFSRSSAGAVYAPANLNIQVDIVSAGANANQSVQNVVASTALSGLTQFWTALAMAAAPAERRMSLTGTVPANNPYNLFTGDVVLVSLIAGAAVSTQTNTLLLVAEWC